MNSQESLDKLKQYFSYIKSGAATTWSMRKIADLLVGEFHLTREEVFEILNEGGFKNWTEFSQKMIATYSNMDLIPGTITVITKLERKAREKAMQQAA